LHFNKLYFYLNLPKLNVSFELILGIKYCEGISIYADMTAGILLPKKIFGKKEERESNVKI
jgi:hypothetical protein